MSIFKRRKNKIKIGIAQPLKKLALKASNPAQTTEPTNSVFDLIGTLEKDGNVQNPPNRVKIKNPESDKAEAETVDAVKSSPAKADLDTVEMNDGITDQNSYTLKKVQKKKPLTEAQSSTDSISSEVNANTSLDDHSEIPLDVEALNLQQEMNAAIDEISELELDDTHLTLDAISEQLINEYPQENTSETEIEDDIFDLDSLDLELNDDGTDEPYDDSHGDGEFNLESFEDEDLENEMSDLTEIEASEDSDDPSILQLRHNLSKISTDFENGDALYKRAQIRIKQLNGFAEKAELSFSLVSRLEPENRRLKARNLTLSRDLETNLLNLTRLDTELSAKNKRITEVSEDLEATHSQLSSTLSALSSVEKELATVKQERDIEALRGDREKSSFDIETRENLNLRSKVSKLTDELDVLSAEKITLTNHIESMKIDMEDLQKSKESSEKNALDVTLELEKSRDHNAEITRQISSIQEDVKSFKTQYEYNVLTRDDRIFALESELQGLSKQLSLKDEILNNTSVDAQNLRKTRSDGELERERLERLIENQSQQLKLAEAQLLQSRANIQEIDKRYKDAATALARVNERRNDQAPSSSPDIRPAEFLSDMNGFEDYLTKKS